MNRTRIIAALIFIGSTASSVRALAGSEDSGWYFRSEAGPNLIESTDLRLDFDQSGAKTKFDPGIRFDAAGGYQFNRYLSLEGEAGFTYNALDSIGGSGNAEGELVQFPFMANLLFQLPNKSRFVPYAGIGGGFVTSALTIDNATIQGSNVDGDDVAIAGALQALAGFRYQFNDRMSLGCGYKFLAMTQPEWDSSSFDFTKPNGVLALDDPRVHSFLIEFTIKF